MTDTTVENTKQQQNSINQMKQRDICGERSGRATGKIRGLKQSVTKDSKYWGCDETKAAALSHQRDQGWTCKKLCKDKARRAQERLVWGDCKKPITEGLKHVRQTPAKKNRCITDSTFFLQDSPGYFIRFLYSTPLLNANTHILISTVQKIIAS